MQSVRNIVGELFNGVQRRFGERLQRRRVTGHDKIGKSGGFAFGHAGRHEAGRQFRRQHFRRGFAGIGLNAEIVQEVRLDVGGWIRFCDFVDKNRGGIHEFRDFWRNIRDVNGVNSFGDVLLSGGDFGRQLCTGFGVRLGGFQSGICVVENGLRVFLIADGSDEIVFRRSENIVRRRHSGLRFRDFRIGIGQGGLRL